MSKKMTAKEISTFKIAANGFIEMIELPGDFYESSTAIICSISG